MDQKPLQGRAEKARHPERFNGLFGVLGSLGGKPAGSELIYTEDPVEVRAERILAIADPADRMRAYATFERLLAEGGESLPPDVTDRISRSLRADAATAAREERRRKYEAHRATVARTDRLRLWAAAAVPVAAGLPVIVASAAAGWTLADALAAAGPVLWPPGIVAVGVLAALVSVAFLVWQCAEAQTPTRLAALIVGGLASGICAVAAANTAPVFKARPAARLADGRSLGGAIIRVERRGPYQLDRLHVLRGAGRVSRGTILGVDGAEPVRWLRGIP
ncbi:MAG: hypothetical protein ICV73_19465 [Acetobacteraceae bacterium]|nr:hypothetical protein [Acetobacteraceae bacterium]